MPRIDYYGIEEAIQQLLKLDENLLTTRIEIEQELIWGAEVCPYVSIYLERRDVPEDRQRLAAGTRTDFLLRFSLWCVGYSLDSVQAAIQQRDDLIGNVEVALMKDRKLRNSVDSSWFDGGQFLTLPDEDTGFVSAGEIVLLAPKHASTLG